jgi:predicted Zn-dependent protease with MMP-like domain
MRIHDDALTGNVTLIVTDFAEADDVVDAKMLWEEQVRMLGLYLGVRI